MSNSSLRTRDATPSGSCSWLSLIEMLEHVVKLTTLQMSIKCQTTPPYGERTLRELRIRDSACVTVFIGRTAFKRAKSASRRPLLVIPYGKDPAIFDWQEIVRGRDIVLIEFGSDNPKDLARAAQAFLSAGAKLVAAVHSGAKEISIFRQSGANDHAT